MEEFDVYVQSYLKNWGECMARDGTNASSDKLLKHSEFYLKNGLYASEECYVKFLEKNGLFYLPGLLLKMASLQDYNRSIFQTDGDLRKLPFPPAFQSAFVKIAGEMSFSADQNERNQVVSVLRVLRDLGMTRIHQSERVGDYYVLPVEPWINFFEKMDGDKFSKMDEKDRQYRYESVCIAEYAKSWIKIYNEMEEWSEWSFSPENEHGIEESITDWMHTLRSGLYSSCTYLKCLESTDIRWLPYLLSYIYDNDQYRVREYFSQNFKIALEKFFHLFIRTECPFDAQKSESIILSLTILRDCFGFSILDGEDDDFEYLRKHNKEDAKLSEEELLYWERCREECCLNSYGGSFVDLGVFKHSAHCSFVLTRIIQRIRLRKIDMGADDLNDIIGVLQFIQRILLRNALPHRGVDWPRPYKRVPQYKATERTNLDEVRAAISQAYVQRINFEDRNKYV